MQQHRQLIREQLGVLEERLEELGALALANERQALERPSALSFGSDILLQEALASIRDLGQLVYEQQLFKSVSANDFLQRIVGLLVQDAAAQGCDIAVAHFGEGRISMEMAELVLGAILAGFRASLKSHKSLSRVQRHRHYLFGTGSIYVEVRATAGEILFRLTDDGQGYGKRSDLASEKHFQKLREHIARCGGWFGHSSFENFGGLIEFKVPLSHNRLEALILRQGDFEVLIPSTSVAEVLEAGELPPDDAVVFSLDENTGLAPALEKAAVFLRIGVADLQFWISCESLGARVKARRLSAADFVEEGSWLKDLGLFRTEEHSQALPLLEGASLVQLYRECGGET